MTEEVVEYIREILRKKRRATVKEIIDELYSAYGLSFTPREMRSILRKIAEDYRVLLGYEEIKPFWRIVVFSEDLVRRTIFNRLATRPQTLESLVYGTGLKKEWLAPYLDYLISKGIIGFREGFYFLTKKVFRVQKMKIWRLKEEHWKWEFYQIKFEKPTKVPDKLVQTRLAPSEETDELSPSTYGCLRVYVYTYTPMDWPERRLERIMMYILINLGPAGEFSLQRRPETMKPYIEVQQAYEAKEIDPDEVPPDAEFDTPYAWAYISKEEGFTYVYNYRKTVFGWELIGRWEVR